MATGGDKEMPESTFPAHEEALHAERGRDSDDQDSTGVEPAIKGDLPSSDTAPTVTCIKQEPVTESEKKPQTVISPIGYAERERLMTLVLSTTYMETGTDNIAGTQTTTEHETDAEPDAEPFFGPMEDMDPCQWVNLLSYLSSSMIEHLLTTLLEGANTKLELVNKLQSEMNILYFHYTSHYHGVGIIHCLSQAEPSDDDWESLELQIPFVQLELFVEGLTHVNHGLHTLAAEVITSCSQAHDELETLAMGPEPDTDSDSGGCQPTTGLDKYMEAMNLDGSVSMVFTISRFSSPVKSLFKKVLEKHGEINSQLVDMLKLNTELLKALKEYLEDGDGSNADDESSENVDFREESSLLNTDEE